MLVSCWSRRMLSSVPHRPPLMFWQLRHRAWHPAGTEDRAAPKPKLANLTCRGKMCVFDRRLTKIETVTASGKDSINVANANDYNPEQSWTTRSIYCFSNSSFLMPDWVRIWPPPHTQNLTKISTKLVLSKCEFLTQWITFLSLKNVVITT